MRLPKLRKPKFRQPKFRQPKFPTRRFSFTRVAKKWISKLSVFPSSESFSKPAPDNSDLNLRDYFNPILWVKWVSGFAVAWFWTRPYSSVVPGIPALALTVGLLVTALQTSNSKWKSDRYSSILQNAHSAGQYDLAKLAINRLLEIAPTRQLRLQLALIEDQQGNTAVAATMMQALVQQHQNPEAALWLLLKVFNLEEFHTWPEQKRTYFQSLVAIAITGSNETAKNARLLYVTYLLRSESKMEAARVLELVAAQDPSYLLAAAKLNQGVNPETSRRLAEFAATHFRTKLDNQPNDVAAVISLSQALVMLSREEEAVRWMMGAKQNEGAAEALVLYAERLGNEAKTPQESLSIRLTTIKRAVDLAPNHAVVLDALTQILIECRESANEELLVVRQSLLNGLDPDMMHFIEGTIALLNEDVATAESHLSLVTSDKERMPGLLNNIAVVLQRKGEGKLPKALEFSNAALDLLPENPLLRETRGEILAGLGRYRDAIIDLEFSLRDPAVAKEAHAALANCYEKLGMDELSSQHRKLSQNVVK